MNPAIIVLAITTIGEIVKQVDAYQNGHLSDEQVAIMFRRVRAVMHAIQAEADTLR